MYAIVKTGGKQYRVEQGQSLLVERLPVGDGETVTLEPLLFVDGSDLVDGADLARVSVEARVVGHERGPKLRIVKFKPKRGYKRRTGHRQDLTRLEIVSLGVSGGGRGSAGGRRRKAAPKPVAAEPVAVEQTAPAEAVAVEETAPAEAVAVEETAPVEAVAVEETAPAEVAATDPSVPEEVTEKAPTLPVGAEEAAGEPAGDATSEPAADATGEPAGDATGEPAGDVTDTTPEEDDNGA